MSEFWKSQPRKFCDFCKCWIADNKVSINFHEGGKRHKEAVELKLREIRRKGRDDERKAQREDDWIRVMEEKAMKDYRTKDLEENPDLTAKIFNEKRAQREADREEEEVQREVEKERIRQEQEKIMATKIVPVPSTSSGFMTVGAGEDYKPPMLRKIPASREGTKWHNPPPKPKVWFEAMSEDGHTYYWNTETSESRWDPPPEGYASMAEQALMTDKGSTYSAAQTVDETHHEEVDDQPPPEKIRKPATPKKSAKKAEKKSASPLPEGAALGPAPRADPYGSWQSIEPKVDPTQIDYQTPSVKEPVQASVTLHSDRLTKFEEKKTPSLADSSSAGVSKPAIVFRKRKTVNQEFTRKRDDENN